MFDGDGEDGVGEAGEGAGEVVLGVCERGGVGELGGDWGGSGVASFKVAAGEVKAAELDGDLDRWENMFNIN